ncbi:MAG: DNA recombination protein RmuC [Bryobacterales bacterium]|nr:DNA recombination protein RmuC [Bryobacterales bacterium]
MDPSAFALVVVGLVLIGMNAAALWRGRTSRKDEDSGVRTLLARLDARLDEQGRRQVEDARALRAEIDKRLAGGFDRTDRTFADVVRRLALVDKAQERITELSSNVVSLREILADRSARGAFGEVQLHALVTNIIPPDGYRMQHTLSNGRRADCMLFLPPPTGNIAIDSKFPLSNFRRKVDPSLPRPERLRAGRAFVRDVKAHVADIAAKYIVPGETCDSAVLFLPAESVFAEIHASHPELVEFAFRKKVWLTSPTTLMAVLTTARSVLKDEATRREVHLIREHLRLLGKDFARFESNIEKLANHIRLAGDDAQRTRAASRRIGARFRKIDELDLGPDVPTPDEGGRKRDPGASRLRSQAPT